jgi:2-succinyl-5-enolpyruvyl-6-hydroxy-3-cyclohexene-1-carboxylate synthase
VHTQVLKHLPAQSAVFVSNSLPIRDLSLFGELLPESDPLFFSARGVSGIDGITSQALGLSLAREAEVSILSKPFDPLSPSTIPTTVLLTGDLAFLHDLNALMSARMLSHSRLVVFVINNRGGQIFRMLPIGHFDRIYEPYFGTPQSADIASLCKGFKVSYFQADSINTLAHILETVFQGNGLTVVECLTDPEASMQQRLA